MKTLILGLTVLTSLVSCHSASTEAVSSDSTSIKIVDSIKVSDSALTISVVDKAKVVDTLKSK